MGIGLSSLFNISQSSAVEPVRSLQLLLNIKVFHWKTMLARSRNSSLPLSLSRCFIIIFLLSPSPDKNSFNTVEYNFSPIKIKTPILPEISELCHLSSRQSVASITLDSAHGWIKIPRLSQKPPAPPAPAVPVSTLA